MIDLEAERALLAGLILNPESLDDAACQLNFKDFSDVSHQLLFRSITELESIDIISIAEKMASDGILESAGGMQFLSGITDCFVSKNIKPYISIIKKSSKSRNLKFGLLDALNEIESNGGYESAMGKLSAILDAQEVATDGYQTLKEILRGRIENLDNRFRAGGGIDGLLTGFEKLDYKLQGLKSGDYFVIGARPSMGKTAFSLALAQNMMQGGDVLYFSAESTKESLVDRLISSSSGVPGNIIKTARLNDQQWASLQAGVSTIIDKNLHIIDIAGIDIDHARAIAKKFCRKSDIKAIFVDYVQLMTCKGAKTEFEEVSRISKGLKMLAKVSNCPVVALAQLSRGVEQRPNKRPVMSDLRATGQIEQDADFIGFLYRDEYYNDDSQDKGITELSIVKNREGETGKIFFSSDLSVMRYKEIDYKPVDNKNEYRPFK